MKNAIYKEKQKELLLEDLAKEVLANARNELYLNLRFMDAALNSLRFSSDGGICLLGTDGLLLAYRTQDILDLFKADRRFLNRAYLHTLMHCLFHHLYSFPERNRRDQESDRKRRLWDLACDITAEYLVDGLYLPCLHHSKSALRQQTYQRLKKDLKAVTAQGVYSLLLHPEKEGFYTENAEGLFKDFIVDDHSLWDKPLSPRAEEQQKKWDEIREKMQTELETFAKEASADTQCLHEMLAIANRRRYDYRKFLRRFSVLREETVVDPDSFDYIFYHYGMELYGNMPLIEPLETKEVHRIEDFVIVLDTSMSCSGKLIRCFLEETLSILLQEDTYGRQVRIRLIQCDDRVQKDTLITRLEELETYMESFEIVGLGGTDFRPAFAYVDRLQAEGSFHRLKGLLYFTDGYGIFPVRRPNYDTAFIFMKGDYRDVDVPPWAMKVILSPEELEERQPARLERSF
ncbi:MAG: metallopeptidase [Blautia sp.]|nr:metallopeptidase [Blautia sp.]